MSKLLAYLLNLVLFELNALVPPPICRMMITNLISDGLNRVIGRAGHDVEDEGDADARDSQDEPEAERVQPDLDADGEAR